MTDRRQAENPDEAAAENLAVPRYDVVAGILEGIGAAIAGEGDEFRRTIGPVPPGDPDARPDRRPAPGRSKPPTTPARRVADRPPTPMGGIGPTDELGRDTPTGLGGDSPMNEGSEDTAVPPVDPAEHRSLDS
jgi:hypothetical protein